MTYKTFLEKLAKTADHFHYDWFIVWGSASLRLHDERNKRIYCPITAVARMETGQFWQPGSAPDAGLKIALPIFRRNQIIRAADLADVEPEVRDDLFKATLIRKSGQRGKR